MKSNNFIFFCLGVILLTLPLAALHGQENHFHVFTRGGIKTTILKGLSNTTEVELRTKGNSINISQIHIRSTFSYKISDYFSTAISYSLITSNFSGGENVLRNRYWIDIRGGYKIERFTLSLRERFQQTFTGENISSRWRQELKGSYSIDKTNLTPFVSIETHICMFGVEKGIDEIRCNIGTSIALNKNNDLEIFGRYFTRGTIPYPNHSFVLGINYFFKFH